MTMPKVGKKSPFLTTRYRNNEETSNKSMSQKYTKVMVQVLNMDFKSTMNEGLPASRWEESSHCMIKGDLVQEIWSRYWEICS